MNASKSEELLAIGWFILATQLNGALCGVAIVSGFLCMLFAFLYAFKP